MQLFLVAWKQWYGTVIYEKKENTQRESDSHPGSLTRGTFWIQSEKVEPKLQLHWAEETEIRVGAAEVTGIFQEEAAQRKDSRNTYSTFARVQSNPSQEFSQMLSTDD